MALKPCPQCGKMISDKAERCPKCGLDVKNLYSAENSQGSQNLNNPPINEKAAINNTSTHLPRNEEPSRQGDPSFIKEPSYNEASYTENPKKSRIGLWVCVCIILAVGIGAAIWIPVHLHNEKLKAEHLALLEQQRLDSISAVEAELARLEQLRQDSIRQDSIKNEEAYRIHPKMFKYGNFSKLKSLGFKKVDEEYEDSGDGPDYHYVKYERVFNGRKTIYEITEWGSSNSSLTFEDNGDKDFFLKELKGLGYKKNGRSYENTNYEYPPIYIEGNKIFIAIDY